MAGAERELAQTIRFVVAFVRQILEGLDRVADPRTLSLRILKIGSCPSLSGKSKLSYEIGCDTESAIYFQITKNSGGGQFNVEWVAMEKIGKALSESTVITSFSLHSAIEGKSRNNAGFLMSVLKHEGLVLASVDEKVRSYQLGDPTAFMAEMKLLIESDIALDPDAKPKKPSKKKAIDPS